LDAFRDFENDELKGWRDSELGSTDRPKALWITGQSRLGKTEWARSLGDTCTTMVHLT